MLAARLSPSPRPLLALAAALLCVLGAGPCRANDKIAAGTIGGQAPLWPFYAAMQKGFFAAQGIDLDLTFAPSGSAIVQELAAGSLDAVLSVGLTEPLHAADKGADIAIVRVTGQAAPYALLAKADITSLAGLRGKVISIGAVSDITDVYFERMMEANGLKRGDYDIYSAGVAAARLAALKAGVAQAALLLPPLNFRAEQAGFVQLAVVRDYVKDLPFAGMAVRRDWAKDHLALAKRLMAATDQGFDWIAEPAHRQEAIDMLVKVGHGTPTDAAQSYDFLRRIDYFEPTGKVSRRQLQNLIDVERKVGQVQKPLTVEAVIMPGLTVLGP